MKNVMREGKMKYEQDAKSELLKYMRSFDACAIAGLMHDPVSGERFKEENLGFTDGVYCWSSQNIYDIEKYNFAVSEEFMRAAI